MELHERVHTARTTIQEQRTSLEQIVVKARKDQDFKSARERLRRWKDRTVRLLAENVHPIEASKLSEKKKTSSIAGQPLRNLTDEAIMYDSFLIALEEALEECPEDVLDVPLPVPAVPMEISTTQDEVSNAVFVIHGRDELNLFRLKELLQDKWGLRPIVMAAEPGKGRTLIEKFEGEAQRAGFAFALMTPDDMVTAGDDAYAQARPNVVFELGWFYGRLGRQCVCILFKQGTKIHSDLDGISRLEFRESVNEKVADIERELVGAGLLKT